MFRALDGESARANKGEGVGNQAPTSPPKYRYSPPTQDAHCSTSGVGFVHKWCTCERRTPSGVAGIIAAAPSSVGERGGIAAAPSNMSVPGFSPSKEKKEKDGRSFGAGGGWEGHGDYMRDKESKLAAQYAQRIPRKSDCLRNVVLHVDGVSSMRQLDLSDLVIAHGGQYMQYLHGSVVTHLLANNLPAAKIRAVTAHIAEAKRKGRLVHAVREAWLIDSVACLRRLPEGDYALPELTDPEQRTLAGFFPPPPTCKGLDRKSAPGESAPDERAAFEDGSPAEQPMETSCVPIPAARRAPREGGHGIVLHLDVDSYFVQCHQVEEPLRYGRHLPLAVRQHQDIIALNQYAREMRPARRAVCPAYHPTLTALLAPAADGLALAGRPRKPG